MKKSLLYCFALILALSVSAFAQSVVITPKKIVYQRSKPDNEFRRTFTITRPQVKGLSAILNKKIERAISFEKAFDLNVKEEQSGDIQWLEEADFIVNYNKRGILDIELFIAGSGAYPSSANKIIIFNLKTGEKIRTANVFTNLAALASEIRKMQQAEMNAANKEYKTDPTMENFDADEYFRKADFKIANLDDFTVSDKGATFVYDYNFPHVVQALEPEGRYFFTWTQLAPFIRREGLFAVFIK